MDFIVNILGSSSATPTRHRNSSSILLNFNYKYYLIDCGEGTQIQLRKFKFKIQRINHIFISHLHGDHFFGLIGLLSTLHLLGRKDELHVFANEKLRDIINIQLEASQTVLNYPLVFHETNPFVSEVIFETEEHYVKSFPLDHRIPTTGFLFVEKPRSRKMVREFLLQEDVSVEEILKIKSGADFTGAGGKVFPNADITIAPPKVRSFAYCSDTRYNEDLVEQILDVDLLYHEATFMEDMLQAAHDKYHSTAKQAATMAVKARAKKLIIGHFSARYKVLDELLLEAREVFEDTQLAEDGMRFPIDRN